MEKYSGRCKCEKITFKIKVNLHGKLIVTAIGVKLQVVVLLDHLFYLMKRTLNIKVKCQLSIKIQKLIMEDQCLIFFVPLAVLL